VIFTVTITQTNKCVTWAKCTAFSDSFV